MQQRDRYARVHQLETLREYALERLDESGEREALARRHAEYYTALAETRRSKCASGEEANQIRRLEAELDNLRAALAWEGSGGELELRLASASSRSGRCAAT